jgi:hypothetical protein
MEKMLQSGLLMCDRDSNLPTEPTRSVSLMGQYELATGHAA